MIKAALGPLPFVREDDESNLAADTTTGDSMAPAPSAPASQRPAVLSDGSYATQTAMADTFTAPMALGAQTPNLRTLLLSGDFYLGGVMHLAQPPFA